MDLRGFLLQVFLKELKFGPGDGNLQYYVYNWKCPPAKANEVQITLVALIRHHPQSMRACCQVGLVLL